MRKIYFLLLLLIPNFFVSCGPSFSNMTVQNNQIPPEFSEYDGTLIIISQYRAWDKYAKKAFKKNYKGDYKLITKKDDLSKYEDVEKYRYFLSPTFLQGKSIDPNRYFQERNYVASEYLVLHDRKTGNHYKTASTAFYGKLLKAYAAALESERSK